MALKMKSQVLQQKDQIPKEKHMPFGTVCEKLLLGKPSQRVLLLSAHKHRLLRWTMTDE